MIVMWKLNSIINADSKDLSKIGNNKVMLTVTSPPYHNAINYQEHTTSEKWYRGTVGASLENWLDEMKTVFSQVYQVTKPGGFCCIVIGNEIIEEKNKLPLPALLLVELTKNSIGWKFFEEIVLDPFVRSGQTTKIDRFLKRKYIGVDKSEKYVKIAKKRTAEPPALRKMQLVPYWKNSIPLDTL